MHVFDGTQGIECHFLEAWHQKLHTNTTPEDITVCEAYIAFLESGDISTYSRVLWENGSISRADMANKWDRKIPGELFQSKLLGSGRSWWRRYRQTTVQDAALITVLHSCFGAGCLQLYPSLECHQS